VCLDSFFALLLFLFRSFNNCRNEPSGRASAVTQRGPNIRLHRHPPAGVAVQSRPAEWVAAQVTSRQSRQGSQPHQHTFSLLQYSFRLRLYFTVKKGFRVSLGPLREFGVVESRETSPPPPHDNHASLSATHRQYSADSPGDATRDAIASSSVSLRL
jgi:hypothetical protein